MCVCVYEEWRNVHAKYAIGKECVKRVKEEEEWILVVYESAERLWQCKGNKKPVATMYQHS